jgi:hypothetical protein
MEGSNKTKDQVLLACKAAISDLITDCQHKNQLESLKLKVRDQRNMLPVSFAAVEKQNSSWQTWAVREATPYGAGERPLVQ